MTSLNGMGFSISLLKLVDTGFGDERSMLEFLDAPTEATGWAAAVQTTSWRQARDLSVPEINNEIKDVSQTSNLRLNPQVAERMLRSGLQRVIAAEPDVTRFDTIVGDGDCGIGIKRGATAVLDYISRPLPEDAVRLLSEICSVVEKIMDGTSGAIYSIFLNALTYGLTIQDVDSTTLVRAPVWARALSTALGSLSKYTPAQPGDRTLVDALHPFVKTLEDVGDLQKAAAAAQKGAESTKGMEANLGRTVYVGGNAFKSCLTRGLMP
jgi:dihydroxyacetone kinase